MVLGNGALLLLIDGPRTEYLTKHTASTRTRHNWFHGMVYGTSARDTDEMWPYDVGDTCTRWRWRARFVIYVAARGLVTSAWTQQPSIGAAHGL